MSPADFFTAADLAKGAIVLGLFIALISECIAYVLHRHELGQLSPHERARRNGRHGRQ